ncbi:hypothetical protein D8881_01690 [Streptococcus sanguinis]|uniref:Uncharacterized protein n=1 Tax=Streptococcus sanguinis TaxID=1305 RepID=A0ABD7JST2_STRSA|nr:hypothetical protein D8881_01690 [Streptococcus sanguinis]
MKKKRLLVSFNLHNWGEVKFKDVWKTEKGN